MKIIALLGSPHGLKGGTGRLLKIVLDGAKSEGAKTETVVLSWDKVGPCLGCNVCHAKGYCKQRDDFELIKGKILEADALILATPNYIDNVSAQLKAFIDRCCGAVHCLQFEGRYGVSVVTSGGGGEEPIAEMMNSFLTRTGIRPVGAVWAAMGSMEGPDFPDEIVKQALTLGKKLVNAVKNKTTTKKVEKEMNAFRERMKALVMRRKKEYPYEYDYWFSSAVSGK
jgi:multimeric flavodoxin WrbA